MTNQLFEAALGIKSPWFVQAVAFDASQRRLTVGVDFAPGSRFAHPNTLGEHPVYDTQIKRLRHLNFFQHECHLEVRVPRVRLPDGRVALVEPDWVGKLSGFTLLFEALVLMLAQQMTFAAVARIVGETWHRVHAICSRYVDLALTHADLSAVDTVAIDKTSYKRGHNYLTLAADADARKVVFVTDGRDADTIASFAAHLRAHKADPENITCVSIDMSPAFIKGVTDHLSNARITFDKFHVIAHASQAVDKMRRVEQRTDLALKGLRWALVKDRSKLSRDQITDLDRLVAHFTTKRTARAWLYREQLRDILDRKQINVVSTMLGQWCTNVMRSKVEPMKEVAAMIRKHFDGIVAWTQTRQTAGFVEAINGLFQAAKRKARGYTRFQTMRTVLFLIAVGACSDAELADHICRQIAASRLHGEGYRKLWARLRFAGVRASPRRVRRVMGENSLRAPHHVGRAETKPHDGTIVTNKVNEMWGTDMTQTITVEEGRAYVFVAVEHANSEVVGIHAARSANRFEALEPVRQGVHRCFGSIAPGVARGLMLRHDHGSNYISGDFQDEIECLGIEASPSFVREPQGNGVAERFIRTLKENLLWARTFDTIEELRAALVEFARHYNETWLVARHGHRTPAQVRADQSQLDQNAMADLKLAA